MTRYNVSPIDDRVSRGPIQIWPVGPCWLESGEKNVSAASVAGELVETALVYFGLEDEKREWLEALARERGCTVDEIVSEAVAQFIKARDGVGRS